MPYLHYIDDTVIRLDSVTICGISAWQAATRVWEQVTCPHCLKNKPEGVLDEVLYKWACSVVVPFSGSPEGESEVRQVHAMMTHGLKLLHLAQVPALEKELEKKADGKQ
jgi:hypothetical protein